MQKTRWIAVLVLIGVFALSLAAIAQIPTANWPRFQRDAYNSGRSPATTIAKPVLKWQRTLTVDTACCATNIWSDVSKCGIIVDPDGNVVVSCAKPWSLAKFNSAGVLQWNTTIPTLWAYNGWYHGSEGGPAVTGTNTSYTYLAGPGINPTGLTDSKLQSIDPASGTSLWSVYCDVKLGNWWQRMSCGTPTVGPNGEVYVTTGWTAWGDFSGNTVAISPTAHAIDWRYGNSYSGTAYSDSLENGLGPNVGANVVLNMDVTVNGETVNRPVIFRTGGFVYTWKTDATYKNHKSFMALIDNGTGATPTLLWRNTFSYSRAQPVVSNDGTKMYIAAFDNWYDSGNADHDVKELTSFNPTNGAINWQIDLPTSCLFSPAVGADGTLYVTGSALDPIPNKCTNSKMRFNPSGRLVAVTDNGTSATIKWTLDMPGELGSDMSNAVVISNSSHKIIYVAVGRGHVYCVEDLGDHPKILWAYNAKIPNYIQPAGYNIWNGNYDATYSWNIPIPGSLALADDGTLYAGWADQLLAFDTGYTPGQSYGISGTVTDAAGNPVAGAMVSVSISNNALIDNPERTYTTTNSDGTYQVSVGGISSSTTYYVAAWKEGCAGTDAQSVTLSSESSSATANFTLNSAKFNWALTANASTNNANTGTSAASYTASKATDGSFSTWFQTDPEVTANLIKNKATYLQVDLGQNREISEATVYWTYAYAKSYNIEYLADGEDPATGTWNTLYTTTNGTGGYPTTWTSNALSNGVTLTTIKANASTSIGALVKMPYTAAADTIKFPATSARYWRVYATAASGDPYSIQTSAVAGDLQKVQYIGIGEIALRDSTLTAQPYTAGGARNTPEGGGTIITSAVVTATPGGSVPADTIFIEDANRAAGIKVHMTGLSSFTTPIQFGDRVSVTGKVSTTTDGEKYIEAISVTRLATTKCPDDPAIDELSMNNKAAADTLSQGLFIKTWGKVSDSATGSFKVSDGSAAPIKVLCDSTGAFTLPANGDYIRVRGVVGKDADGIVLYMRNERADWALASDNIQALPFTGTYDYPIQYLVLGPFSAGTDKATNLATDFIGESNIGQTVFPAEGMTTAGKTWFKATSANELLNFNAAFGGTNDNAVAYALIYVWSETEAPQVALASGSDDALKYYVNGGQEVFSTQSYHVIGAECHTISLNQGLNSILFKVVNGTGAFTLGSQFVDGEFISGAPGYGGYQPYTTTGLGYSLNPVTP